MSALVLKMTTAASPIIHHNKKPYCCYSHPLHKSNLPHHRFPNPLSPPRSAASTAATYSTKPIINNNNKDNKRGWWRIGPCAPLAHNTTHNNNKNNYFFSFLNQQHHHHHLGGPRFVAQHKCLCVSDRSENKGEITGSAGVMAGMGSENNHKGGGQEWYESQLHQTQDPLLKPIHNQQQQQQQQQQNHSSSKFLTLPTILTLGRVAAVPLLISTFYVDSWWGKTATTSIFIVAAITDWLDGYLARRMRLGSAFGAFLDPVADKLMVAATLVLLCSKPMEVAAFGQVPWLFVVPSIAIIGREITMSAVREWAASQNTKLLEAVAVNNLGKWKTASQMIALTILLATRDSSLGGPEALVVSGVVLLYISAGLAVWSLGVYMSKIWKVLLK